MINPQDDDRSLQPPLPPRISSLASPSTSHSTSTTPLPSSQRLPAGLVASSDTTHHNNMYALSNETGGNDSEVPPSYEETRLAEPDNARFGRWRNWVEKRANERREERDELKQSGKLEKSSWNLPDEGSNDGNRVGQMGEEVYVDKDDKERERARRRDDQMEKRLLAASNPYRVSNPDPSSSLRPSTSANQQQERRSRSSSSASGGGAMRHRLTKNVTIEQLGSRFDRGLPDQPLCGMVLPTQSPSSKTAGEPDRFLLIGTQAGLYLADLDPVLSSSAPLRTSPLPSSPSNSPARIIPIWTGLAVHHLDCFVEDAKPKSDGAKGLLLALVSNGGELEIRMWSIAAIINLIKWRTYNETSKPLHLASLQAPSHSSHHNRTSSFTALRSFLGSPSTTKGKGKEPSFTQSHSRRTSSDSSHALSDQPTISPTSTRSRTSSSTHLRSPSSPQEPDSLPFEWYNSHVKLPLPKPHTPILFFQISRMPPRDSEDDTEEGSEEEDTEDLNNEQLRRKRIREEERGKLFLLVATKSIVYLFESGAGDKRSWKLTRELTAPSTPRFVQLVRSPELSRPSTPSPLTASHHSSHSSSSPPSVPYPSSLCLLLGMSHHTVLIRLSSYDVLELQLPSAPSPSLTRARTKSLSNSVRSTTSSHRSTVSLSLKDNSFVKKVQEFVESKSTANVPMEFRGEKGIALGRRLGGGKNDSLEELGGKLGVNEGQGMGEWVGIEELVVPIRGRRTGKRFQLVSKGHSTYLVESPLTPHSQVSSTSDTQSSPLAVKPSFSFKWPSDQSIRRVSHFLTSTPEGRTHLTLIAFTSSGVCVQEGYLSLDSLSLFTPTRPTTTSHLRPDSSRLSLEELRISLDEEEEEDLSDKATLDFGRKAGWLSDSLTSRPRPGGGGQRDSGACYVWTKEHSDYIVKRVHTNL